MHNSERTIERRNSVRLFGEKSVSVLLTGKKLIFFTPSQTIESALKILTENNIQGAPIEAFHDEKKVAIGKRKKSKWLGIISILDLVKEVLKEFDANMLDNEKQQQQLLNKTLGKLWEEKNLSTKSPFFSVYRSETIEELLMLFGRGIHRVAVTDEADNILHIVTQSTVVGYIAEHNQHLGKLVDLTMQELGFLKKVFTVNRKQTTIEALKVITDNKISAVAIVDDEGKLVGNLSASDLKGLIKLSNGKFSGDFFTPLRLPVGDFLSKIREMHGKSKTFILTCTPTTKLKEVVQLLAKEHVHRIFIVDTHNKPCGIVSLTDICAELFLESEEDLITKRLQQFSEQNS
jgi:CBS-domain-containing membrane protein